MSEATDMILSEVSYTESEKDLRDLFISEFVKDYNVYTACLRIGLQEDIAKEFGAVVFHEPYVQRGITQIEEARSAEYVKAHDNLTLPSNFQPHNEDTDIERIKSGLFREAFFTGHGSSHAARVAALGKLSAIYGIEKKEEKTDTVKSNVMVVPGMASLDDWEAAARKNQQQLLDNIKEDV